LGPYKKRVNGRQMMFVTACTFLTSEENREVHGAAVKKRI